MCENFGINIVSYDIVKVWFQTFISITFDTEDEPRSGHPIKVDCEQLLQIIVLNRNVSTYTIALELNVCQKTLVNDMKCINLTFKFNRLVPYELTPEDNGKRKKLLIGSAQKSNVRKYTEQKCDL